MSGSLHLVGGGWGANGAIWRGFLDAAARPDGSPPRVLVIAVRDDARDHAARLVAALRGAGPVDAVVQAVGEGRAVPASAFDGVLDGVVVGGGTTPAVLDALLPHAARIRALVGGGAAYAGFSAGSAIAPERALVGGWRRDGVPVVAEDAGEDLAEVAVRDGLGLLPFGVEVHAAQWGTLARLLAAVGDGLLDSGVAVDEDTALVVDGDRTRVVGSGNAWRVERAEGGVAVRRRPAGREPG